jgi:5-methylcytosine-specific restriction protein A
MPKPSGGWKGQPGSRHERGYGSAWTKTRAIILARDKHLCQPCARKGMLTPARTVDHIKPKAQGGTDAPDNLEATCDDCHKAKTTKEGHQAAGHRALRVVGADGYPVDE